MADIYVPRLKSHFIAEIRGAMAKEFSYKNEHQIPSLDKVVLNMGLGKATSDSKIIKTAQEQLELISGQKVVVTKAKKSIASFKVREDMPLGLKVTLRRNRMYEFIDRLITIALPRVRDFRGLSGKSFDGRGNYAFGITEHIIFPEVSFDNVEAVLGMDVVVCTTASSDAEAKFLLKQFNFPFSN